jgi:hypothetical protein
MFTVYKKIVSPESSPVLGPVPDANNATNVNNAIEPFALCNYCCSNRNKPQSGNTVPENTEPGNTVPVQNPVPLHPEQKMQQAKYEFGHATHYVYGVTSPRLLCEFETGTIP